MRTYARALEVAESAAREAGAIFRADMARPGGPRGSGDKAKADEEAERVIVARLAAAFPDITVRGEETAGHSGTDEHVWLVDPNDGTSAWLRGHRGSAVSIALLRAGVPVLGVVYAYAPPIGSEDAFTWAEGCGPMRRNGVPVERRWASDLRADHSVAVSQDADARPESNAEACAPARYRALPSIAYRLALAAAGEVEAAVSLNGPQDWDYAGGHALLLGVGGVLVDAAGRPVTYSRVGVSGCGGMCVGGGPLTAPALAGRRWSAVRGPPSPTLRPAPYLEAGLLDRAQGSLLGQLCGDALGAQVEFVSAAEIARRFPGGVRELSDGGTWNTLAGQPTDDSELALSLARVLVRLGRWDEEEVASAYAGWMRSHPFDAGSTTRRALASAPAHGPVGPAIRAAANPGSTANGALMRVSPLGIFGHALDRDALAGLARRDARLTHPNPVCQDASAVYVLAVADAVSGRSATEIHANALALPTHPEVREVLEAAVGTPLERFPERHGGDVRVSLHAAFHGLLHAPSVEEALVAAVAMGRDSDTDAAITGGLVGALHGAASMPLRWRERVLCARAIPGRAARPRPRAYWPVDALDLAGWLAAGGVP